MGLPRDLGRLGEFKYANIIVTAGKAGVHVTAGNHHLFRAALGSSDFNRLGSHGARRRG